MAGPTAQSMKLRFPEFVDIDDSVIEFALAEALLFVNGWTKPQVIPATMYLAAHFLAVDQVSADSDGRDITSETIGRLSTSYRVGQGVGIADLASTSYGKRYIQLRNLTSPSFQVI